MEKCLLDLFQELNECAERTLGDGNKHIKDNLNHVQQITRHLRWFINLTIYESAIRGDIVKEQKQRE